MSNISLGVTGNSKGHFEDWDFVDLHRESLTTQGVNREGWTTQANCSFSEEPEFVVDSINGTLTKNDGKKGGKPYISMCLAQKYLNPEYN